MRTAQMLTLLLIQVSLAGCVTHVTSTPDKTALESSQLNSQPITLTYGAIKKHLKAGVTTQADVLEFFGSPNNMTVTSEGTEIWVYDKIKTELESQAIRNTQGGLIAGGFGVGSGAFGAGVSGSSQQAQSSVTSTTKTLTVIMSFDKKNILTSYSARSGRY